MEEHVRFTIYVPHGTVADDGGARGDYARNVVAAVLTDEFGGATVGADVDGYWRLRGAETQRDSLAPVFVDVPATDADYAAAFIRGIAQAVRRACEQAAVYVTRETLEVTLV